MLFAYKVFISSAGDIVELKDLSSSIIAGSIQYDLSLNEDYASLYNLNIKEEFRRQGLARKLRTCVISRILKEKISRIITYPCSYTDKLSTEKLISFYIENFKELGSSNILIDKVPQNKITASF